MHQLQSFETWLIRRRKNKQNYEIKTKPLEAPSLAGSLGLLSSFLIIGKGCTHLGALGKQTQAFIIP